MHKLSLAGLAMLAALVTGCPHNDYTVELTPRGQGVERRLDFYRADGVDDQGVPKYESFPSNELAAITALYPAGAVTRRGEEHSATGVFSGTMPGDVGGAGTYHQATTSLGAAGIYLERFRGNDDLIATASARSAAADQLTDLVIGWSRAEFGREPGYKNLRRFLDVDFRHDLKNFGQYCWLGETVSAGNTNAAGEFTARFGQYLLERHYVKMEAAPDLVQIFSGDGDARVLWLAQKLVAEKLGVPQAGPLPKALVRLTDPVAVEKSWDNYMTGTKVYRARLRQWEKDKQSRPDLERPDPSDTLGELVTTLMRAGYASEDDHLTVRLALPAAPFQTNGRWDEARRQVIWQTALETRETARRLPVFCHANWSKADDTFQQLHFGGVILTGEALLKYCFWQSGLKPAHAGEWENLLKQSQPGGSWTNLLATFRFSDESTTHGSPADYGRGLLQYALEHPPQAATK